MMPLARRLLAGAAALVLAVNLVVWAGVAWNRSAETSRLRVGERELALSGNWGHYRENSALALLLQWRVEPGDPEDAEAVPYARSHYTQVHWLDAVRLAELGMRLPEITASDLHRRWRSREREVWLALEFDGPAHAGSLARAERRLAAATAALEAQPQREDLKARVEAAVEHQAQVRDHWSRLVVVDADADADALRARHPEKRVAVVQGRIAAHWHPKGPGPDAGGEWRGHIEALSIETLHVPRALRAPLDGLPDREYDAPPDRYDVELVWGRRFEPWLVDIIPAAD